MRIGTSAVAFFNHRIKSTAKIIYHPSFHTQNCVPTPFDEMIRYGIPVLHEISNQPFMQSLQNGTVDERDYLNFLAVDAKIFLPKFANVLQSIADKFNQLSYYNSFYAEQFIQLKRRVILSAEYADCFCLDQQAKRKTLLLTSDDALNYIPEMLSYIQHLEIMTKHAAISEAVTCASVCFWLYAKLDEQINVEQYPVEHVYRHWSNRAKLRTYVIPSIASTNALMLSVKTIINDVKCPLEIERNKRVFKHTLELERDIFKKIVKIDPPSFRY